MTTKQIDNLLHRYEQAATTEAEERRLRQLATAGQLPGEWNAYFSAMAAEAVDVPDGLEERLSRSIDALHASESRQRGRWWRRAGGMAAMVAILLSAGYWAYGRHQADVLLNGDTFTDPQAAYDETELVLTQLAQHLNRGDDGMEALEKMTLILNNP